ncbi:hypothetical protein P152DRAFT_461155 [Eremomyces bilateralis CBS 781.70]|uniref:Chromo domain-containing protein n=1 Tax=Eremomyces bilateralis CBS 781.70 TaxID=1392243 RepID=A0A6G1FVH7_9PEZI|nr:uncharacterized protein P152DRAFT_461155 [Eremomyces bilateralis CBS 781.70]KAF1809773.1 hypothetical protein P152DRAFT_461155 [Eremomyces bilateralis CBS 781.70]
MTRMRAYPPTIHPVLGKRILMLSHNSYEVEAIHGHEQRKGEIVYNVKWKGYDESENTLEPERHIRQGAEAVLQAYWDLIGGKPEPATKGKRKRQPTGTPAAAESSGRGRGRKRSRVGGESDSATPEVKHVIRGKKAWEPPKGSWEKEIVSIDTLEEQRNTKNGENQVYGFVVWNNGQKSKYLLETLKGKCPQKLIEYFEQHLVFRHNGANEGNDATQTNGSEKVDDGGASEDEGS